jgi:hypothetical protein
MIGWRETEPRLQWPLATSLRYRMLTVPRIGVSVMRPRLCYRLSMERAFDRLRVSIACSIADKSTTCDGAGIRTAGHPNRPGAVRVQPYVRARLTNQRPPVLGPTTPRGEKKLALKAAHHLLSIVVPSVLVGVIYL